MRWTKLGKIFDPADYVLPDGCRFFAQSPQALVLDDVVRIYFSTRSVDASNGKFLSRIAFVDMTKDFRTTLRVSDRTVIPLGDLGSFDEHGIFPMNVLRHDGAVYGYTCGWNRRVSVSVDTAIGLAISRDDGLTFTRLGPGPVLSASLQEPFLVGDGFVRFVDGTFHMWYIFGTAWRTGSTGTAPDRVYKIGHATSPDGICWTKEDGRRIIADRLGEDECQALPSVVRCGGVYRMAFCYRECHDFRTNPSRGYRIGQAVSENLREWTRVDDSPALVGTPGSWDSDMQCYPHIFDCDGITYLLYNGNAFGQDGFGLSRLDP